MKRKRDGFFGGDSGRGYNSTQVDLVANTTKKSHWQGFAKGKQWDAALRVALHITNPE